MHRGLGGTKTFPRLTQPPGQGCIQPPSPQALQAPLVLHWLYLFEPPLHLGLHHNHPPLPQGSLAQPPQGKPASSGWGLFSWCLSQTCSVLVSERQTDRQTGHLQPEPIPQPLSWVGNKPPPAPARQIHVCLANPFFAKGTRALGPGCEAEQLPRPTAAGICLLLPQQADGAEAEKETAFLLDKKIAIMQGEKKNTLFSPHRPAAQRGCWYCLAQQSLPAPSAWGDRRAPNAV